MDIHIVVGWWCIPTLITIGSFIWFWNGTVDARKPATGYGSIGNGIVAMIYAGGALILTLAAWLAYFVAISLFAPEFIIR